ncbi:MAG: hypothetical protein ACRDRR_03930 [Pseudonocardiaceae bacterium]
MTGLGLGLGLGFGLGSGAAVLVGVKFGLGTGLLVALINTIWGALLGLIYGTVSSIPGRWPLHC